MAWTAPSTFVAGAILTAASLNTNVRDNSLAGGPIYATEALRDAAITSPFEGQRAYITGSTEAAATGSTTAVPTGIQTIYNGTSWVCVTQVGALVVTSQTTTSTSYVDLATAGPAVTLRTGTTALVNISALITADATSAVALMNFAVSGATTRAAVDTESAFVQSAAGSQQLALGRTQIISGLTAGINTFTTKYRVTASTGRFENRTINVQGIA